MSSYNYSSTPASNTSLDGIGVAGSDSPQNADNAFREIASNLHDDFVNIWGGVTAGGSADALEITLSGATVSTAFAGMSVGCLIASNNTGAATLNVSSIGAEPIKKMVSGTETALAADDLVEDEFALFVWRADFDSSNGAWEWLNLRHQTVTSGSEVQKGDGSGGLTAATPDTDFVDVDGSLVSFGNLDIVAGDIVYGSNTDTVSRLAKGSDGEVLTLASGVPSWASSSGGYTDVQTETSIGTGTSHTVGSIPSDARVVVIRWDAVSRDGGSTPRNLTLQLGDSGGIETSGYTGSAWTLTTLSTAGATHSGYVTAHRIDSGGTKWSLGSGSTKTLSGRLTQVRLILNSDNYDAGTVAVYYLP